MELRLIAMMYILQYSKLSPSIKQTMIETGCRIASLACDQSVPENYDPASQEYKDLTRI